MRGVERFVLNHYVVQAGADAGVDYIWKQENPEIPEMLEKAAELHLFSARRAEDFVPARSSRWDT